MMEGLPVDMVEDDVGPSSLSPYPSSLTTPGWPPVESSMRLPANDLFSWMAVTSELTQYYHVRELEDVRVIRDRQTKISRQLAFIRFPTIEESREFLEQNFPAVYLYGKSAAADGQGAKVRIAYSREREDRNRTRVDGEWTCINCSIVNYAGRQRCFRCQASKPDAALMPQMEEAAKVANNGDNDVSTDGTASQFILFRGLESSVTEEVLAKGVAKLCKQSKSASAHPPGSSGGGAKKGAKVASTTGDSNLGAREGSIRRILLVRDRRTNESWKYGFAEFATVEDAQCALARYSSFETFTISSKPVLATYIHAGVFVPVLNLKPAVSTSTSEDERFTFSPLGNLAAKLAYWDEDAYASELKLSTAATTSELSAGKTARKDGEKEKKRKKADAGTGGTEFKTEAHVRQHERLSQLHRDNLQDETLKAKAVAKLAKKRTPTDQTEYRDRAKERRRVFGSSKSKKVVDAEAGRQGEDEGREAAPAVLSKGAALLGKMGWSAGSGLGAEGTGMKQPVAAELYVQGVGLGAQGSKVGDAVQEAGRSTRGRYDEFLEKTREHARERYERMKGDQD
ncbi:RNA-binding protein [Arthroderma uncinatum]|uniref:RNA-binding protein n=1 Tax=Arthroderma uncinatum TaxID=74035 RepID=UPI00144A9CFD|nr:RNA-binding protein [Arthroderma uncinatum]KAF3480018.1 RNA-binding protein [Arthroderma uncinatum]